MSGQQVPASPAISGKFPGPVPLENSIRLVTCGSSGYQAAREYSLIKPPRTGFRWIRARSRSVSRSQGCSAVLADQAAGNLAGADKSSAQVTSLIIDHELFALMLLTPAQFT